MNDFPNTPVADARPETPQESRADRGLRLVRSAPTPAVLDEPSLFYDPPYEDALTDALAYRLVRTLAPGCTLQHRAVVLTPDDCFRVDFLVEHGRGAAQRRFGMLIDAPAGTTPDRHDALVVGTGAVDVLYRFRRADLERHRLDALYLMSQWDPALFRASGRVWLARHASDVARRAEVRALQGEQHLHYPQAPVNVRPGELPERPAPASDLFVRRWSQQHPAHWVRAYSEALQHYSRSQAWPRRA